MVIWKRILNLNFREILLLAIIFISNPGYINPTLKATRETMRICSKLFGSRHHGNNKANAYRHALWNYSICEKTLTVSGSLETSLNWAKRITELHEKLSPNPELEKLMDFHNNKFGRNLFLSLQSVEKNIEKYLHKLKK